MSQLIYGHIGYGIILRDEGGGVPPEWLAFGNTDRGGTTCWWEGMLQRVLQLTIRPEDAELEIVTHYLRGQQKEGNRYRIPLLVIKPKAVQVQTSSGDSPVDFTELLTEYQIEKAKWDELIASFVQRCKELGIEIHETAPHFMSWLSWDDSPTT